MAEVSTADVEAYTHERLDPADDETIRMLAAALKVARREAGWHVSPVLEDQTIQMDGPGSAILWLPTMKLTELTGVTEDDVVLDLSTISISVGSEPGVPERVRLRKKARGWWTDEYGGLTIEMSHGFTEDEAADWRQAILSMVDQMSLVPVKAATGMSDFGAQSWRVDDVQVGYSPYAAMAEEVVFSIMHIIDDYRLPGIEFL